MFVKYTYYKRNIQFGYQSYSAILFFFQKNLKKRKEKVKNSSFLNNFYVVFIC